MKQKKYANKINHDICCQGYCDIILKRSITFLADIKRAVFKNVELL